MRLIKIGDSVVDYDKILAVFPDADGESVQVYFSETESFTIKCDEPNKVIDNLLPVARSSGVQGRW